MTREAFRGWRAFRTTTSVGRSRPWACSLRSWPASGSLAAGRGHLPRPRPARKGVLGVQKASERLRNLITAARNADGELRWIPSSVSALRASAAGCGISPSAPGVDVGVETGAGALRLQIRPVRGLDRAWTYRTLAAATTLGVAYIAIPDPPGRLRWTWPMQVGFLVGHAERSAARSTGLARQTSRPA